MEAMPDLSFQTETVSVSGEDVLVKFGMQGTHAKTFILHAPGMKPLPPTNKRIAPQPALLHYIVSPTTKQITKIYSEPGHEGSMVYLLKEMGAKLPPLWLARLISTLARLLKP
jgi:hypothetical protein